MPVMSAVEQAWCRSIPWRAFTRRVVFPWAIGAVALEGDVLELGSGSGAMAAELLRRYPAIRLTATDVDPAMRAGASKRLASFGERAVVRDADAPALPVGRPGQDHRHRAGHVGGDGSRLHCRASSRRAPETKVAGHGTFEDHDGGLNEETNLRNQ